MTLPVTEITPLLLTFNEEDNLERTLAPLSWAREIVVIDSGSTDRTLEILARDPRIRVIHRNFDTHATQWNFGLKHVATDWVLSLDADYEISREFAAEIARLDPPEAVSGYLVSFTYCVFGRPLRATLYPPRICLFRRDRATYWDEGHTQRLRIEGEIDALSGRIHHDDRKPIDRWFRSQIGYARREADHLLSADPAELGRIDRLRLHAWIAPLIMPLYMLLARGGEFQREVQRFQAKRSLTSLPSSLKRAWIGVM